MTSIFVYLHIILAFKTVFNRNMNAFWGRTHFIPLVFRSDVRIPFKIRWSNCPMHHLDENVWCSRLALFSLKHIRRWITLKINQCKNAGQWTPKALREWIMSREIISHNVTIYKVCCYGLKFRLLRFMS